MPHNFDEYRNKIPTTGYRVNLWWAATWRFVGAGEFEAAAENQSTAVRRGTRSRPCGRRKSSSGPTGTIRVGLIDVWL